MLTKKSEKSRLIAKIHIAIQKKGVTEEAYREWLEKLFNVRSSKYLDESQLIQAVEILTSAGWLDGNGRGATSEQGDRPSAKQWAKLAALSRQMGWDGLEDKALSTFCKRTAKVDSPRFLNRNKIRVVISALQKWHNSLDKKAAKTTTNEGN